MKTFLLVFAFVPVTLAFMAHGPGGSDYLFWSLLLLWFAVETLAGLAASASVKSINAIHSEYDIRFHVALESGALGLAREIASAEKLFSLRGAA